MRRVGEKVLLATGGIGEIIETKRFIGLPYRVRLEDGSTRWLGPMDMRSRL